MKHTVLVFLCLGLLAVSCSKKPETRETALENPLLASAFNTPFGVPPFELIKDEHFRPAFEEAMRLHKREVAAIVDASAAPTFENTVAALADSGELLARVSQVFDNLSGAHTNDAIKAIEQDMAPIRTQHNLDISLNPGLFQRIKAVYGDKASLELTPEQDMLLEKTYKDFVRGGADLAEDKKARFREINGEIARLTVQFGQNVLNDTNAFEMLLDSEDDLTGLPQNLIDGYAEAATAKGAEAGDGAAKYEGKWLITLHKPSFIPFLIYSERRDLREKVFKAFANVANNGNEYDNKAAASRIAALRVERAHLLGYESHAAYILEDNMAKKAENVYELLLRVWKPALEKAKQEVRDMQAMIQAEGKDFKLRPWDWWHYAEKVKKARYDLDDQTVRPYFQLENVRAGMFDVANKLWGITFTEIPDIPKYLDEVTAFEVKEADGTHVGVLYTDYFPRESKQGGAWMNAYRKQYRKNGTDIRPVSRLHELRMLMLVSAGKITDLSTFADLRHLRLLCPMGTGALRDISHLRRMPHLVYLMLVPLPEEIEDLSPIAELKDLRHLVVDDDDLRGEPERFEKLRKARPDLEIEGFCMGSAWILAVVGAGLLGGWLARRRTAGAA